MGIVLGLPCLAASAIIAGAGVYTYATTVDPDLWWKSAPLAKQETASKVVTFDDLIPKKQDEPQGPWTQYQQQVTKLVPIDYNPFADSELRSSLLSAGFVAVIGFALFGFCWAVGWTLAGFARD